MDYLKIASSNGIISLWTGLFGGVGSYMLYGTSYYTLPILGYTIPNYLMYGIIGAGASMLLQTTGDIINMIFSDNKFSPWTKISTPLTVGLLSLGIVFLLNGLEIPNMDQSVKLVGLMAGAYIVSDWTFNKFMLKGMINQTNTINDIKNVTQNVSKVNLPTINPIKPNGFGLSVLY